MLHALRVGGHDIRVAAASSSRRNKAMPLLSTFEVAPGVSMMDVVDPNLFEMFYRKGEYKRPHLEAILNKSGIAPDEVIFVDDNADNTWAEVLRKFRAEQQPA